MGLAQWLTRRRAARYRRLADQHRGETIETATRCDCGEVHRRTVTWSPQAAMGGTATLECDACRRVYKSRVTIGADPPLRRDVGPPYPHTARWRACGPEVRAHVKVEPVRVPNGGFVRWKYTWEREEIHYCPWCGIEFWRGES